MVTTIWSSSLDATLGRVLSISIGSADVVIMVGSRSSYRWLIIWKSFSSAKGVLRSAPISSRTNKSAVLMRLQQVGVSYWAVGAEGGAQVVQQVGDGGVEHIITAFLTFNSRSHC